MSYDVACNGGGGENQDTQKRLSIGHGRMAPRFKSEIVVDYKIEKQSAIRFG